MAGLVEMLGDRRYIVGASVFRQASAERSGCLPDVVVLAVTALQMVYHTTQFRNGVLVFGGPQLTPDDSVGDCMGSDSQSSERE